jgi:hypothetical protein
MRIVGACFLALCVAAVGARADALLPLRDAVVPSSTAMTATTMWDDQAETAGGAPISPTKAVLYSLLLPGLGDYQLGNKGRASAFFAVEGAIWIAFGVFQVQGSQREEDYEELAMRFAGVSRTGHSDEFYATVREYANSEDYEAVVKLEGRNVLAEPDCNTCPLRLDRINAEALEQYFTDNRIEDYEPWQWSSHERQLQYSEVRSSSKTSYRRADYMFAAAAANRIVSAVVAYGAARSANKAYQNELGYRLHFTPTARGVDFSLTLTRSF